MSNWEGAVYFGNVFFFPSIVFHSFAFIKFKKSSFHSEWPAGESATPLGRVERCRFSISYSQGEGGAPGLYHGLFVRDLVQFTFLLGRLRRCLGAWGPGRPVRCTCWVWKRTIVWQTREPSASSSFALWDFPKRSLFQNPVFKMREVM